MSSHEQPIYEERGFTLDQLGRYMQIVGITGNRITGRINDPVPENLAALKEVFRAAGNIAYFERTPEGHEIAYGYAPPKRKRRLWVNVLLFVLTIGTTLLVGSINHGGDPFKHPLDLLLLGWPFSLSIILVLGSHELAHFLAARRLGVDATPPYFLPIPHPMTGTMGAFIRINSPVPTKSALVRVGVSACSCPSRLPLAGHRASSSVLRLSSGSCLSCCTPTSDRARILCSIRRHLPAGWGCL
jgi:membrane-associated protease RseP (regulator of RpoE activity)